MTDEPTTPAAGHLLDQILEGAGERAPDEPAQPPIEVPMGPREQVLHDEIMDVLRTVYDPEIPVNIYELGLIYFLKVEPGGVARIDMTLTSPACPVAESLPVEVENKIRSVPGVSEVHLSLVWDPPYSIDMMSEAARLQLGLLW